MKTWLHFVLMSIALLAITERALAITINTRGTQSCGTWIKERNAKNESYERAWLTGFLTGLAIAGNKEFWGGVDTRFNRLDNESVSGWITTAEPTR